MSSARAFFRGAFVSLPIFLICSCAGSRGEVFNFASDGPPRAADEAVLEVYRLQEHFGGTVVAPYVYSVDGKDVDRSGNALYHPNIWEGKGQPKINLEIRLSPGTHNIEVGFDLYNGVNETRTEHHGKVFSFQFEAGKTYDLVVSNIVEERCPGRFLPMYHCGVTYQATAQERAPGVTPPRRLGPI
jgi:hypothetical protein